MNRSSQHWIVTEVDILKLAEMLMCISGMMQSSVLFASWSIVYDGLKYMIPVLGALIVILRIHSVTKLRYIMTTLGISILIVLTCILTKDYSYFVLCIILVLSKKMTINDFVRISFKVLLFFGGMQIGIWLLNCVVHLGYPVFYNQSERRISFLFSHPNIAAIKLGWGIVMYTWLKWDQLNWKKWGGCAIAAVMLYSSTKADSCMIILFYLIMVALSRFSIVQRLTIRFSKYCFLILGAFNILMAQLYRDAGKVTSLIRSLDLFFSRRLAMAYLAINDNGLSIIGQTITKEHEWNELFNFGNYTIDSLYIYFYVCIGIVYFVLIAIGFWKLAKYKDYRAALIVIMFSLYAMIEVHCLYLTNCFALLLLKYVIFNNKRIE